MSAGAIRLNSDGGVALDAGGGVVESETTVGCGCCCLNPYCEDRCGTPATLSVEFRGLDVCEGCLPCGGAGTNSFETSFKLDGLFTLNCELSIVAGQEGADGWMYTETGDFGTASSTSGSCAEAVTMTRLVIIVAVGATWAVKAYIDDGNPLVAPGDGPSPNGAYLFVGAVDADPWKKCSEPVGDIESTLTCPADGGDGCYANYGGVATVIPSGTNPPGPCPADNAGCPECLQVTYPAFYFDPPTVTLKAVGDGSWAWNGGGGKTATMTCLGNYWELKRTGSKVEGCETAGVVHRAARCPGETCPPTKTDSVFDTVGIFYWYGTTEGDEACFTPFAVELEIGTCCGEPGSCPEDNSACDETVIATFGWPAGCPHGDVVVALQPQGNNTWRWESDAAPDTINATIACDGDEWVLTYNNGTDCAGVSYVWRMPRCEGVPCPVSSVAGGWVYKGAESIDNCPCGSDPSATTDA